MSAWGKAKLANFPNTVWGEPGWGRCDPEWHFKVHGRTPLFKQHHPPTLEFSTRPKKNSCSSKNCTYFDTLPVDILHTIAT